MPSSGDNLAAALEGKSIKFSLRTGGVKYEATMYKDRSTYERAKALRSDSGVLLSSSSTTNTAPSTTSSSSPNSSS